MKCKFCNQEAGVFKRYHIECKNSVEETLEEIEDILNWNKEYEIVPSNVKLQLKKIALSNELYVNYLESEIIDKTAIHRNEVIIFVESMLRITESKNRCKMVSTGYRYEKSPVWSEKEYLLDNSGRLIFTNKAIYLYVNDSTMRYPYSKVVNYGYDKIWKIPYTYFDIKTSSPYPHRFSFQDPYGLKDGRKEQNIVLLLHCLI